MASPVGLAIRNERALARLNDALAQLAGTLGVSVPDAPGRSRDAFLSETLRIEWMADSLEVMAASDAPDLNSVYHERNQTVAALSKVFPALIAPVDDAEEGFSSAVFIDLPTGQVSWHITDEETEQLFGHLPVSEGSPWDNHTTDEKYERLNALEATAEPMPVIEREPEGENDQVPDGAGDAPADTVDPEGDDAPSQDSAVEQEEEGSAGTGETPSRDDLERLKLDELKQMAADRGIDGVENARAKADVIDKLLEVAG